MIKSIIWPKNFKRFFCLFLFAFLVGFFQCDLHAISRIPAVLDRNAAIQHEGKVIHIDALSNTIVELDNFSIDQDEIVNVTLPGATSRIFIKVVGNRPTEIRGSLISNGQVLLINESGFIIYPEGSVKCANFTASTFEPTSCDCLNLCDLIFRGKSEASFINEGRIESSGGRIALLLLGAEII